MNRILKRIRKLFSRSEKEDFAAVFNKHHGLQTTYIHPALLKDKEDPVKFCEEILGMKLHNYQKMMLRHITNDEPSPTYKVRGNNIDLILHDDIENAEE